MAIAGIDVGTTGCKISVYEANGTLLFKSYHAYEASRTFSEHELSPDAVWSGVQQIIKDATAAVPDIRGIGVSSFGETFALLDDNDRSLINLILYTDPRGTEECEELIKLLPSRRIADITGAMPHKMYTLSKLMWLQKHQPDALKKARRILLIQDFIVYMLTGVAQIDPSLAARTLALDIHKKDWSREVLDAVGIEPALFSKVVPSGTIAGPVRENLRLTLGVSDSTVIVSCCHDQVAAAVGGGAHIPGMAVDGAGTTECITPVFPELSDPSAMYAGGYAIIPYVKDGLYVCYAFSFTGGALVTWFLSQLAGKAQTESEANGVSIFAQLESGMYKEPSGILLLPHFAGAGTPYMNADARGAIVGLTIEHSLSDLYQAVLEGVAYEMRINLESLNRAGICPKRLNATGGGAKSERWLQIKADILGTEIVSLGDSEAGIIGGIMLTGVATGAYDSLEQAAQVFIHEHGIYTPDPVMHEKYTAQYSRYKKLYEALKPI